MQFIAIILLSIGAAVGYGIIHDQITARICVEYFTIGHPPVFSTDDPTLLGIGWGIIATWWMGALLGLPLAVAARVGKRAKLDARQLLRPIGALLLIMAVCAIAAGAIGWFVAASGWMILVEPLASRIPAEKHVAFLIDGWAHSASYAVGFFGGVWLIIATFRRRARMARADL